MPNVVTTQSIALHSGQQADRNLLGVEWLRVIGTIFVVMLHSTFPFGTLEMPGLHWPAVSTQKSTLITLLGWGTNAVAMPLFFLMSGYMAAGLLQRDGASRFLKNRMLRIGGSYVMGVCLVLPLTLYVWLFGWVSLGKISWRRMQTMNLPAELHDALFGMAHLWYLFHLVIYSAVAYGVFKFLASKKRESWAISTKFWKVCPRVNSLTFIGLMIAVTTSVLIYESVFVIGFRNSFFPRWENLVYYSVPFFSGWIWKCQADKGWNPRFSPTLMLSCGALLGAALIPTLPVYLSADASPSIQAGVPLLWAAFGIFMSIGLFDLFLNLKIQRIPRFIKYLSQASFWIYISHLPVVCLIPQATQGWGWSAWGQFSFCVITALVLCTASYEVLVRRTWIGWVMTGKRSAPLNYRNQGTNRPTDPCQSGEEPGTRTVAA